MGCWTKTGRPIQIPTRRFSPTRARWAMQSFDLICGGRFKADGRHFWRSLGSPAPTEAGELPPLRPRRRKKGDGEGKVASCPGAIIGRSSRRMCGSLNARFMPALFRSTQTGRVLRALFSEQAQQAPHHQHSRNTQPHNAPDADACFILLHAGGSVRGL